MQAEMAGTKFAFDSVITLTATRSPKAIRSISISGINRTMHTPATATETIAAKSRVREVFQDCTGAISAPIATAVISGKIISFSPKISAEPTIIATTARDIPIAIF